LEPGIPLARISHQPGFAGLRKAATEIPARNDPPHRKIAPHLYPNISKNINSAKNSLHKKVFYQHDLVYIPNNDNSFSNKIHQGDLK
jgi:hypothetical protein